MDTRCANPELQLDVDLMVLEYALFQAVETHLDVLSSGCEDESKVHELRRVVAIFDSFIGVFNQNHPSYEHSPEFNFRLQILEFSVLLFCRSSSISTNCDCATDHLSSSSSSILNEHARNDLKARRTWLARRARDPQRDRGSRPASSGEADIAWDSEQQIYGAWTGTSSNHADLGPRYPTGPLLLSLLPRFMTISARFTDVIKQGPSDIWMDVACEFMLQASLESLQLRSQDDNAENLPRLEDCFAWGYIDLDAPFHSDAPSGPNNDDDDDDDDEETTEILVNNLFRSPLEDLDAENPAWTQLRVDTLHEFSLATRASAPSRSCRLERLAGKYPYGDFQQRLASLVRAIWKLSCRDEICGKPVLVEIGEGHVKSLGLEGADFERFVATVGLTEALTRLEIMS